MDIATEQLAALIVAVSVAAGLNLYATIGTLGLLARFGMVALPPALDPITSPWVIGASLAMFTIEFFADKIPIVDLIWNALHTFVRVPAAGVLAWAAAAPLSPSQQLLAAAAGAALAFTSHAGKMAMRAAVTPSPEPASNIGLSLLEDATAIGLTWFATSYPYLAAAVALALVVGVVVMIRLVWRAARGGLRMVRSRLAGRPSPVATD